MKYLLIASVCAGIFSISQLALAATDAATLTIQSTTIAERSLTVSDSLTAVVGKTFVLDGSKSQDDGVIRKFVWTQVEGPTVKIPEPTALKIAVVPSSAGTYVFELRVTDATGKVSVAQKTSVKVSITAPMTGDPDFDTLTVSPTSVNPLYNDGGTSGTNPMYEEKTVAVPTTSTGGKVNIAVGDVNGDGKASPALLEIGTVPGESTKGNVEAGWKVEEGTKLQGVEPDEIDFKDDDDDEDSVPTIEEEVETSLQVNKVTVQGWDPKKKEEFLSERKTFAEVKSQQDLEHFASGVLLDDEAIEEVEFNPKEISVSYQAEGKLLWLFPMNYTERMVVSEEEGTLVFKAKKPWYGFLIHSNEDPDNTATAAKDKHKDEIDIESISWGVSNQAHLLKTISNVLKTKHDTAKNSVSNVR